MVTQSSELKHMIYDDDDYIMNVMTMTAIHSDAVLLQLPWL